MNGIPAQEWHPWGGSRLRSRMGSGEFMLLVVAAVWGSSYALAKQATQQLPVPEFLALRFGLTFVLLLPALKPLWGGHWRQGLQVGGLLGGNLLAIFLCETYGVSLTTATNAAFLISLCVAFTPLVEWFMLGQRPPARMFWAAGVSVLGAALLADAGTAAAATLHSGLGNGLMVLAALLRAFLVCLTKRVAGRHALPALTLTALQAGVMALGALLLSLLIRRGAWPPLPMEPVFWFSISFLVLFCTVFAFFAQNYAAARTSPSRVSLLMGCEPVFGALFALLWLGEPLTWQVYSGGSLIVLATWWATTPQPVLPDSAAAPIQDSSEQDSRQHQHGAWTGHAHHFRAKPIAFAQKTGSDKPISANPQKIRA
ncbi:DMT family transporter [uncultured Azohydromonas sp.]|mgnify:CR=1 FL=1|uniref:DMT family transporter n=1 Tax=uncultured Azohydromonas sp. TaxID=487342 RepID=UPI00261325EF|nr:DMT family transporter [uncultured Azohydromonas sp.]